MASRVCLDCPAIIPKSAYKGRCRDCARRVDKARGTRTQRGYGSTILSTPLGTMTYDQARAVYQSRMDAGLTYRCACGCGQWVGSHLGSSGWHLAHDERDRGVVVGPMVAGCNLSEAGRSSHSAGG